MYPTALKGLTSLYLINISVSLKTTRVIYQSYMWFSPSHVFLYKMGQLYFQTNLDQWHFIGSYIFYVVLLYC